MPELFDAVPILDLTTLEDVHDLVSRLLALGLLTNEKVELCIVKIVFFANASFL